MRALCLLLTASPCLLLPLASATAARLRAPRSSVETVYDFSAHFEQAETTRALGEAGAGAYIAGGVRRPGISLHPTGDQDTTATFAVPLPAIEPGERLILSFWIGLRDGARLDDKEHPSNGVGFAVQVSGKPVFRAAVEEHGWFPEALDLSADAGKTTTITLATNSNGDNNINYDWAVYGEPQVLRLRGDSLDHTTMIAHGSAGVLALRCESPAAAAIEVRATDAAGEPLDAADERQLPAGFRGVVLMDYDFASDPAARDVRVHVPDGVTVAWMMACEYHAEFRITHIGPTRALVYPEEEFHLGVTIENAGRAALHEPTAPDIGFRIDGGVGAFEHQSPSPSPELNELPPGGTMTLQWDARSASRPGRHLATVTIQSESENTESKASFVVVSRPPELPSEAPEAARAFEVGNAVLLENRHCRIAIVRDSEAHLAYALAFARRGDQWQELAALPFIAEAVYATGEGGETSGSLFPAEVRTGRRGDRAFVVLSGADGPSADTRVELLLGDDWPYVRVRHTLRATAPCDLLAFRGITLAAGDRTYGTSKQFALFPGVEYLKGDERSSSTRDFAPELANRLVPDPWKVTVPLMAVQSDDGLVGVMWDQTQRWDGQHWGVSAKFASPNFAEGQDNHLMQLFLPAGTDLVPENASEARLPYRLRAGDRLTMSAHIVLDGRGGIFDAIKHYCAAYGLPRPLTPPRSYQEELALCRYGFMHTVWDEKTKGFSHCQGWAPGIAPGFCTLLWYDAHLERPGDPAAVLRRIDEHVGRILAEQGPEGLASLGNCHILRFEFPFHYGHLRRGLEGARKIAYAAMASQEGDGSWRFHPDAERAKLGKAGDATVGTCAPNAGLVLKYARITGDEKCLAAGRKALDFMMRFEVPRGAQAWECPLYEPDILASAWALAAYLEGYRATGDRGYLDRAVYWAHTGLPFPYAWYQPDRPGMLYASVPVFGSTFYTHSWLGVPVQWCGLVYAYHLQHLARFDDSFPWTEVARGITTSGMFQQFGDEKPDLKGCYPDGFYGHCTVRGAPYINPEDIMVNDLALHGEDPDVSTRQVRIGDRLVTVSSGADILDARATDSAITVELRYFEGTASHTVACNVARPARVMRDPDHPIARVEDLDASAEGWVYDESTARLYMKVRHGREPDVLRITF